MRSMLTGAIGLLLIAVGGVASARESAVRAGCPGGYERLGEICISAANGDIVTPTSKETDRSAKVRVGR